MKREGIRLRPTGLWLVFGPVLACMWLAAVNYSNNLVYAILYLIGSLSFVSIFHTWRNLAGLQVEHIRINPAFVGEEVRVEIFLSAPARRAVYGLVFARVGEETGKWPFRTNTFPLNLRGTSGRRIALGDSACAEATFVAARRGLYRLEALTIKSSFPFGLIWASFQMPLALDYYIYPRPHGTDDWPELRPGGEGGSPYSTKPGDDFSGVRPYSPGESLRHIDWKAYARGRALSVKQFTGGDGREMWLDAGLLERMPLEARLSQLALWIVNAEKEELPYALRLGRATLPLGLGPAHSRRALETLAVAGMGTGKRE